MPISAPYNFVPLSKFVYFPEWADQVSHDIPFEDGISGELVCELTTKTPVYVRNGGNWTHDDIMTKPEAQSFFNVNGTYMIPGTSLKGMLRNVIEIATFGKMCRVDDNRYSVRDLNNRSLYQERFVKNWHPLSKAAWLTKDPLSGELYLEPCDYARVEQSELQSFHPSKPNLKRCKSSVQKYNAWGTVSRNIDFNSSGYMDQIKRHPGKHLHYDFVTLGTIKAGSKGTLVFTGQPGGNKHMEFIFFNASGKIKLDNAKFKDFEFIHSLDGDITKPNEEWKHWKNILNTPNGKVPVFYLMDSSTLHSFGLSQMYKLPYGHTIHDVVKHTSADHFCDDKPDFAETLFGYVSEKKSHGHLKGRVSITHASGSNCAPSGDTYETVLAAPKPTYYPSYLEQPEPAVRYRTFMDPNPSMPSDKQVKVEVRGWKRYPTRDETMIIAPPPPPDGVSNEVRTKFIPLQAGANFSFRIKVYNLTKVELGALIWALELGGNQDCLHSLGMGKVFGFGLSHIAVSREKSRLYHGSSRDNLSCEDFILNSVTAFTERMKKDIAGDWQETPQLVQLLAMTNHKTYEVAQQRTKLRQMVIGMGQGNNEFVEGKGNRNRGVPPQALAPHVPFHGKSDAERFKGVSPHSGGHSKPGSAPEVQPLSQPSGAPPSITDLAQLQAKFKKR